MRTLLTALLAVASLFSSGSAAADVLQNYEGTVGPPGSVTRSAPPSGATCDEQSCTLHGVEEGTAVELAPAIERAPIPSVVLVRDLFCLARPMWHSYIYATQDSRRVECPFKAECESIHSPHLAPGMTTFEQCVDFTRCTIYTAPQLVRVEGEPVTSVPPVRKAAPKKHRQPVPAPRTSTPGEAISHGFGDEAPWSEHHLYRKGRQLFACPIRPKKECNRFADHEQGDEACADYKRCMKVWLADDGEVIWK